VRIGIVGCAGRMGRMLVTEIQKSNEATLAGGTEPPGSPHIGQDPAALAGCEPAGVAIAEDAGELFAVSDAVIDFTAPAATVAHAALAANTGTALVVGTTGLSEDDFTQLRTAGERTVVVQAANFSIGVNLLLGLTEQVAGILGGEFDIEILEMHHRHKVDAPSGTALALGEAAAAGRQVDLTTVSQRVRDGITGARATGDIGFATLRGGGVVGEHTVMFASEQERIELTHKAASRAVFAAGALRATLWTAGRANGFYTMRDILGFS